MSEIMIREASARPPIAVLCGRTIHREAYRRANALLTLRGYVVLSCGVFKNDPEWGEESKVDLDALHRSKIAMADLVVVIQPGDVGVSTTAEIAYAQSLGKPLYGFSADTDVFTSALPYAVLPAQFQQKQYQARVYAWVLACFGPEIAANKAERSHRFLEEALELVQSVGCTQSEAQHLVEYVYNRPPGDPTQETGGVMVTLAALCQSHGIDMQGAGETELARVWTKVAKIRAKQAAKPQFSPLPEHPAPQPQEKAGGRDE